MNMLKENLEKALCEQLNAELYSSYLYLSMSAYFSGTDLAGFANWMRVQAQEELAHAMKFYDHINARDGRVILKGIKAPPKEWNSPLAAFEHVHSHEQKVTGLINYLVKLAQSDKDNEAVMFLSWFVNEQVEEEASAAAIVKRLELIGGKGDGLALLDKELALRVFTPPATPRQSEV